MHLHCSAAFEGEAYSASWIFSIMYKKASAASHFSPISKIPRCQVALSRSFLSYSTSKVGVLAGEFALISLNKLPRLQQIPFWLFSSSIQVSNSLNPLSLQIVYTTTFRKQLYDLSGFERQNSLICKSGGNSLILETAGYQGPDFQESLQLLG